MTIDLLITMVWGLFIQVNTTVLWFDVRANWIQFEAIAVDSRSTITRTSREIEGSSICREQP